MNTTLKEHSNLLKSKIPSIKKTENFPALPESFPKLPVNMVIELEKWEKFLENSESFKIAVNYFKSQVSPDVRKSTRRIMSAIMTNKFAQNFDWDGTKCKRNFKILKTVSLILSCFKEYSTTTNFPPAIIEHYISDCLKQTEFQDLVLTKLNHLCNHISIYNQKLEPSYSSLVIENEHMKMFPITDDKQMADLEIFLSDKENLLTLAVTLQKRGIDAHNECNAIHGILKRILTNSVAECYSWNGLKGKKTFKTLNLAQLILDTVRLQFPLITDDSVATVVGNWLRYAKQRRQREDGKTMQHETKTD